VREREDNYPTSLTTQKIALENLRDKIFLLYLPHQKVSFPRSTRLK